jgi:hypothetical protein
LTALRRSLPDETPVLAGKPLSGASGTDLRSPRSALTFNGKLVRVALQRSAATGAQLLLMDGLRRLTHAAERRQRSEAEFITDVQALAVRLGLVVNVTATSEASIAFSLAAASRMPPGRD